MTKITNYKELHVYDFDNTLFDTRYYDEELGVSTIWIQYILNDGIRNFVKKQPNRFVSDIDHNKFTIKEQPVQDDDQSNRYEVLYDGHPLEPELYQLFSNKIRSNIEQGIDIGGNSNKNSYYIIMDPKWYYTSKSFEGGDIIWNPTGNAIKKSISQDNVYTVIMTGRRNTHELRYAIVSILRENSLIPDEVHLSPGGSTSRFKISTIESILNERPSIDTLVLWEDRYTQANTLRTHFNAKDSINFSINMVKREHKQLREFVAHIVCALNKTL